MNLSRLRQDFLLAPDVKSGGVLYSTSLLRRKVAPKKFYPLILHEGLFELSTKFVIGYSSLIPHSGFLIHHYTNTQEAADPYKFSPAEPMV